jgi:hypothetical protein
MALVEMCIGRNHCNNALAISTKLSLFTFCLLLPFIFSLVLVHHCDEWVVSSLFWDREELLRSSFAIPWRWMRLREDESDFVKMRVLWIRFEKSLRSVFEKSLLFGIHFWAIDLVQFWNFGAIIFLTEKSFGSVLRGELGKFVHMREWLRVLGKFWVNFILGFVTSSWVCEYEICGIIIWGFVSQKKKGNILVWEEGNQIVKRNEGEIIQFFHY